MTPTAAYLTEVYEESKSFNVLQRALDTSPFQLPGLLWYDCPGVGEQRERAERERALKGEVRGIHNDSGPHS